MNMSSLETLTRDHVFPGTVSSAQQGVVVIIGDDPGQTANLARVCEFLELRLESVSSRTDLSRVLDELRPMAVISDVEGDDQDGFHVMKVIAGYNRDLPVLLLTGGDPVLMGAADAIQELWGLSAVTPTSEFPTAGQLVAFLFGAGRRAGCMRLVPV